jgi:hypothetical protein
MTFRAAYSKRPAATGDQDPGIWEPDIPGHFPVSFSRPGSVPLRRRHRGCPAASPAIKAAPPSGAAGRRQRRSLPRKARPARAGPTPQITADQSAHPSRRPVLRSSRLAGSRASSSQLGASMAALRDSRRSAAPALAWGPRARFLPQYGCDEENGRDVLGTGQVAALAAVPHGYHAARRPTARTSRLPVLARPASAVARARGGRLAGAGLAGYPRGPGRRDSGRSGLQLPRAVRPQQARCHPGAELGSGRACWRA